MYPESGPSRLPPSYPNKPIPGNNGPAPSPRPGSSRWEGEYDPSRDKDERFNGYSRSGEPSSSRPYAVPPWQNRTPRQGFRGPSGSGGPGPRPRSHTPSPPRRGYERDRDRDRDRTFDVRDRLSLDSGWRASGAPPNGNSSAAGPDVPPPRRGSGFGSQPMRDREGSWARDDRRWNERRDDRFRDEPRSLPSSRPGSAPQNQGNRYPPERIPPPRSPPAASRNIRQLGPAQTPPAYASSRIPSSSSAPASRLSQFSTPGRDDRERGPFTPRDGGRPTDRAVNSAGPSSLAYSASQRSRPPSPSSTPAPRAPRSMRGSSSPVDTRRARDGDDPQSAPNTNIPLPTEGDKTVDEDLEEGEVVSPVQPTRVPTWSYNHEDRNRRAYSPPRDRDRWEREHDRERDRRRTPPSPHWAGRRPLNDTWTVRGRRRSNSNPTRWREDDGDFNAAARSPKKPVLAPEEGEVAPTDKDDTVIPPIIETGEELPSGVDEKLDRPPTPPIPPPPAGPRMSITFTQSALEVEKSENGLQLEVPSQPSRPDTPVLPPSPIEANPHANEEIEEQIRVELSPEVTATFKVEAEGTDRPETPIIPPASIDQVKLVPLGTSGDVEPKAVTEVPTQSSTEPNATIVALELEFKDTAGVGVRQAPTDAGEPPLRQDDQAGLAQGKLDEGVEAAAEVSVAESMEVDEALDASVEHVETMDVTTEDVAPTAILSLERTEEAKHIQDNAASGIGLQSPSIPEEITNEEIPVALSKGSVMHAAPPSDQNSSMAVTLKREKTPPSPVAPISSSSEAAMTPAAMINRQVSVEVEIAQPMSDTVPSPTSSVPVSLGKPVSNTQARSPLVPVSRDDSSDTPSSPSTRKVTIAERRAIQLPPTNGPLSSPFGDRFPRKDPMPTAHSTDAETEGGPKTADIDEEDLGMVEDATEETRLANLITAIKTAQKKEVTFDITPVVAWNVAAAPTDTSRVVAMDDPEREGMLKHFIWPLAQQQDLVAKLVARRISQEQTELHKKSEKLKAEYMQLDEEWRDHCDYLDSLMEKRGPPPADLYAVPGAMPIATPGPVAPTTPLTEDMFNARGNRRRGAGDAVTTEAEFEAILAGLADTAAKDPTYRANKTSAVVPDMLLGEERKLRYNDDNDLITDPLAFYDFKGNAEPIWIPEERALFVRRYMAYPKQFGRIADGISNKTASDCVLYYYRTKKEVDYKGMLASKRGGGKKKTIPIKKGGKSAALLADLEKKKPTVSAVTDGASTPVRGGKDRDRDRDREDSVVPGTSARRTKNTGTPAEDGRRRRRTTAASNASTATANAHDDDDKMESTATSRATSEAPSVTASKAKMRVTMKTAKRPRVSSISETARQANSVTSPVLTNVPPDNSTPLAAFDASTAAAAGVTNEPATPTLNQPLDATIAQTELLPPVKRAGKRRKVAVDSAPTNASTDTAAVQANGITAAAPPGVTPGATPSEKPSRRSATNSYWSVEEKRKVKELVAVLGTDVKAIAAQLKGKSERQVGNFLEGHRAELLEGAATAGFGGVGAGIAQVKPEEDQRASTSVHSTPSIAPSETFRSAQPTRTIYDAFPSFNSQDRYEPRLGMFPPSPPHATSSINGSGPALASNSSPVKPVSRSGGMRISALLNDDGPSPKPSLNVKGEERERPSTGLSVPDTIDAASDGTVDERDLDVSGAARPSPRSIPPVPINHTHTADPSGYPRYDQHYSHPHPHHQHQQQHPDQDRYRTSASVPAQTPYLSTSTAWSTGRGAETSRKDSYHHQRERERERATTTTPVPSHHTVSSGPHPSSLTHRGSWSAEMHSPHPSQPHVMPVGSGHRSNSHSSASTTSASSRYDPYRGPPPAISVDHAPAHAHAHQPRHYDYPSERAASTYSREMDQHQRYTQTHHAHAHAHVHSHPHAHSHPHSQRPHQNHHMPNSNAAGGGMSLPSLKSSELGLGLMPMSLGSGTNSGASGRSTSVSPSAPPPQLTSVRSYDERGQ
ncbi:hypothetical protein I316_01537 [Kwoniella heveanensis BCC8398]|uniref:SANT domain-containing protein n=1 Tax=Kwoniella heveanensis BCC8398 TaxID=1296120 RepID=A0A1B9H0Z6_9TREE|nr:hypothetical protein I316_01537 [Kwoniella heveanensis BCC8398]